MKTVFISTSSFGDTNDNLVLHKLKDAHLVFQLNPLKRTLTTNELIQYAKDADSLIAGTEPITEEVFRKCPKLRIICRCGTGLDNIDLKAAERHNIKCVATQPPVLAVAELTIALMLCVLRSVHLADCDIRQNRWKKYMGNLLFKKTVGIIGYGRIGMKVEELLQGFQPNILVCDIQQIQRTSIRGNRVLSLHQLLQDSDVVTIHLPYDETTRRMINNERIQWMQSTSVLINTSRGGIVDEEALYYALKNHKIKAAALDVFEQEPYYGPLCQLENVLLTTHMGSYAQESRSFMENEAVDNLLETMKSIQL